MTAKSPQSKEMKIDWVGSIPFLLMHAAGLLVFWAGLSWPAIVIFLTTLAVRIFGLTGGYHRYFSHRAFQTSRVFQFILGFLGAAASQMGPIWWANHHRHHHRFVDTDQDIHSPSVQGFFWSHIGWVMCVKNYQNREYAFCKDLKAFPELVFLDRYFWIAPLALALSVYGLGAWLEAVRPEWGTSGFQMLVWGFFLSTIALYHITFSVNSFSHVFGDRRFHTKDTSRNNWLVALLAMGEGWHNNHHRYAASAKSGMYWWEVDFTYGILRFLSWLRIVWNLRLPPPLLYEEAENLKKAPA